MRGLNNDDDDDDVMNDGLLDAAIAHAVAVWKHTRQTAWMPPLDASAHACDATVCTMEQIPVRVFTRRYPDTPVPEIMAAMYLQRRAQASGDAATTGGGGGDGDDVDVAAVMALEQLRRRRQRSNVVHVCVPRFCAGGPDALPDEHWKQLESEQALWICAETGVVHRCTGDCAQTSVDDVAAGESICRLTGVVGTRAMHDKYWNPNSTRRLESERTHRVYGRKGEVVATYSAATHGDRVATTLDLIMRATDNATLLSLIASRRTFAADRLRDQYYVTACGKIAMLFSRQRVAEVTRGDLSAMGEHIAGLKRFIVARAYQPLYMTEVRRVSANLRRAKPLSLARRVPDDVRHALIRDWAMRVVRFWYILRTQTRLGRTSVASIPFYEFIDVAIHLFAEGVSVPRPRTQTVEHVIRGEPLFHMYAIYDRAIDYTARANAPMSDKLTEIKTNVKSAIVDAVNNEHVAVERLRLDSVTFEQCANEQFVAFATPRARR